MISSLSLNRGSSKGFNSSIKISSQMIITMNSTIINITMNSTILSK